MKSNLKIKVFLALLFSILVIFIFNNKSEASVTINSRDITLYALNQEDKEKYNIPDIPAEYPQSFQLEVSGSMVELVYHADTSSDVKITEKGLITPKEHTVHVLPDDIYLNEYGFGNSKVYARVDGVEYEINVEVIDYAIIYADSIVKEYLDQNIKSNMTELEKLEVITKYVANLDYSEEYQSYKDMVLSKSGDCWASCNTIIRMCEMVGIKAENRYAVNDVGAGSGHRNVIACVDGKYYIADAGFSGKAPRDYEIREEPDGLCFKTNTDGTLTLIQYDAFDENVVIPSEYNGKKVTKIGENCFWIQNEYTDVKIKSVVLPNTIIEIGESAFSKCEELSSVNIPASVTIIGASPFKASYNVKVTMSENNQNYKIMNNILYNKDGTVLIESMVNEGTVTIPNGVKTVGAYAFSETLAEKIILPDSVTKVEECAFYKCSNLIDVTLPNTLTELSRFLFADTKISKFTIGSNVKKIGEYAFGYCYDLKTIVIPKNVKDIDNEAFYYAYIENIVIEDGSTISIDNGIFYDDYRIKTIRIPTSITNIANGQFRYPEDVTIITKNGSTAEQYAKNNNIKYMLEDSKMLINNAHIFIPEENYGYTGSEIKPNIEVYYGGTKLTEGTDYICSYSDDLINVGKKEVTIQGIGKYEGTSSSTYNIVKVEDNFTFKCDDVVYGNRFKVEILEHSTDANITWYFKKPNSSTGFSNPTEAGVYQLVIYSYGANYIGVTKTKVVQILKADNEIGVSCNNVVKGSTPNPVVVNNKAKSNVTYYYKLQGASDNTYTQTIPTKSGKYVVKAVAEETNNYNEGVATAEFEIMDYIKGDMDKNGELTAYDAYLINLIYEEGKTPTSEELQIGDIDGNGELTAYDAFKINVAYENGELLE